MATVIIKRVDDEYLAHYGVLGMKWGVRRYQNKDGSYTNAGKRRNFREIERAYLTDKNNHFKTHNSGETYRKLTRNNPDMAKALEPAVKAEQKMFRARQDDAKLWRKEYDKLVKEYVQKHGKRPDGHDDHVLSSKADRKVGTPNWDAQLESYNATSREVVDNVLGKYGDKRLNTFNEQFGWEVLDRYISTEAQLRNKEEDERNRK